MTSFVVETYVPDGDSERFAADVHGIRRAIDPGSPLAGLVHHVRSYLVPSDQMGFHVVRAGAAEDIVRMTTLASIQVERIVEAIATDDLADSNAGGNS